jgi:hypothetical protein
VAKPKKSDRQAVIDKMRAEQRGAERRRGFAIVGVCAVVALLIVGAAAYQPIKDWYDLRQFKSIDLSSLGAPASACQPITTKKANGTQDHVEPGTPMTYPDSPPAFGKHWNVWDSIDRKLYTAEDRPELGELVHNEEHGYTLLWYDQTVADNPDQMKQIEAIASKFQSDSNLRNKFKAVPWLKTDGGAFPEGQHVAMTHWTAGAKTNGEQEGVWQYCSAPSGAALKDFMLKYPYTDSPEPTVL